MSATIEQLTVGLRAADAAGNVEDANRFADLIRAEQGNDDLLFEDEERSWGGSLTEAAISMPRSTAKLAGHVYDAVTSPIETGKTIIKLMSGGLQNLLGDDISNFINEKGMLIGLGDDRPDAEMASIVGEHYANKYGSEAAIKEAIATDPASVLADVATIFTGGGALVAKTGEVANVAKVADMGNKIKSAGFAVDPLVLAAKGTGAVVQGGGKLAKNILGGTTGVGVAPLEQAFKAGKTGGQIQKQFMDNIKGAVPMEDALNIAKNNLEILHRNKQAAYQSNKKLWGKDKKQLNFDDIDNALNSVEKMGSYKGQVINKETAELVNTLRGEINAWKGLDAKKFHTPEGLDQLKQKIWSSIENLGTEQRTAQAAGKKVYHSIKNTISKQSPNYARAMKEYTEASEMVNEITATLSLGKKALTDTSMRKLQSLMRDNVNTNYGQRAKLGDELAAVGKDFRPALAGQALREITPRGITKGFQLPTAAAGYMAGGPIAAAAGAAAQSPRVAGMGANVAGKAAGLLETGRNVIPASNEGIQGLLNYMYQTQQAQQVQGGK
ncbi:MAG: hypothetical protein NZ730_13635 [Porticoccaceae bacterium]|nr:hypothetical protein [Porticoccaceae bacterium]